MPSSAPLVGFIVVLGLIAAYLAVPKARGVLWKIIAVLGAVMVGVTTWFGLIWAPPERFMMEVGRIIYVHVPFVWMCMLAFTVNVVAALSYLFKKSWKSDALAEASAEVGVFFGGVGVMMGSIWARPTWGVWWDWDPRLISTTVMLLVYVGYLAFRSFSEDPERRASFSAVASILGYVSLPITWFSVQWWNSLHQRQSDMATVDRNMRILYLFGAVSFLAVLFVFIVKRYEIARARQTGAMELPPLEAPIKAQVTT